MTHILLNRLQYLPGVHGDHNRSGSRKWDDHRCRSKRVTRVCESKRRASKSLIDVRVDVSKL